MSSPSPGKRRMDTDVVKLYPLHRINNLMKFLFMENVSVSMAMVTQLQTVLAVVVVCIT